MSEPSDNELQEFVARFVGWIDAGRAVDGQWWGYRSPSAEVTDIIPDYLGSLDAWHRDVWPKIESNPRLGGGWYAELGVLFVPPLWALKTSNADSRSRCLALYRALDGLRIKIKLAEYKRLHRLLTGINARKVWECLSTGTEMDLERVPDEFFQWVEDTKASLRSQFIAISERAGAVFDEAQSALGCSPRKDYAEWFLRTRDISGLLFSMLDNKPISGQIWKMIYPEHSPPWKKNEDEN